MSIWRKKIWPNLNLWEEFFKAVILPLLTSIPSQTYSTLENKTNTERKRKKAGEERRPNLDASCGDKWEEVKLSHRVVDRLRLSVWWNPAGCLEVWRFVTTHTHTHTHTHRKHKLRQHGLILETQPMILTPSHTAAEMFWLSSPICLLNQMWNKCVLIKFTQNFKDMLRHNFNHAFIYFFLLN